MAEEAAACYAQAVRAWGRAHIPADVDLERFNHLAQQLIDAADADALPLFAGWRTQPCPDDDPADAAMQRVHVLREHRGACHLAAVRLCGLSAREAMVINLGVERAAHYGWREPEPVDATRIPRWQRAERITDEMQMPLYARDRPAAHRVRPARRCADRPLAIPVPGRADRSGRHRRTADRGRHGRLHRSGHGTARHGSRRPQADGPMSACGVQDGGDRMPRWS
ncbi:hypothetical protein ACFCYX_17695 [Streptomyces populi]|uniref:helix-turn-helix domain-containing protein n=1 Tax=Streptomyces populi TaxID=2058924 RepID=UPI0013A6B391|nr:hypothetical protein [Streptomyces populi]